MAMELEHPSFVGEGHVLLEVGAVLLCYECGLVAVAVGGVGLVVLDEGADDVVVVVYPVDYVSGCDVEHGAVGGFELLDPGFEAVGGCGAVDEGGTVEGHDVVVGLCAPLGGFVEAFLCFRGLPFDDVVAVFVEVGACEHGGVGGLFEVADGFVVTLECLDVVDGIVVDDSFDVVGVAFEEGWVGYVDGGAGDGHLFVHFVEVATLCGEVGEIEMCKCFAVVAVLGFGLTEHGFDGAVCLGFVAEYGLAVVSVECPVVVCYLLVGGMVAGV